MVFIDDKKANNEAVSKNEGIQTNLTKFVKRKRQNEQIELVELDSSLDDNDELAEEDDNNGLDQALGRWQCETEGENDEKTSKGKDESASIVSGN